MLQARAVLLVLSACGLRVAELAHARLSDLRASRPSFDDRALLEGRGPGARALDVEGKGGRRRTVPVPAETTKAVLALRDAAGTARVRGAALVPGLSNHRPARVAAADRGILERRARIALLSLAEAVNEHTGRETIASELVHPHALCHGFAVDYITAHPAGLGRLQQLLGHSSIATNAQYLAAITDG